MVYIGIDNGRTSHQYCVLRAGSKRPLRGTVANNSASFEAFCEQIEELFPNEEIVVGIEEGGGMSSPFDLFMEQRGWLVRQLSPRGVATYRETILKIYNKTDDTDAFTMAKMLEADAASIELSHEKAGLRRATRWRNSLVSEQTRYINQLRATMAFYWPESAGDNVFPKMDLQWVLDLISQYPDPVEIARAGTDVVVDYLRERGSRVSKVSVERVVEAARQNSSFASDKAVLLVHTRHLALLLRQVLTCIAEAEKTICAEVEHDRDVRDMDAIVGISTVQASTFVSEVRTVGRFKNDSKLASYGGLGRKRKQTGKSMNTDAQQRHANQNLKQCILGIAETMSLHEERSRLYYKKKIEEGKGHRQAIRALARHVIRRLYAIMVKNRQAFLMEAQPQVA